MRNRSPLGILRSLGHFLLRLGAAGQEIGPARSVRLDDTASVTWAATHDRDNDEIIVSASGAAGYTDEQAQDAVGTILTDSATVDFTYNDAANTISADVKDDSVSDAKLRNSGACSVIGRSANSAGDPADISASADNQFLGRAGGALAFAGLVVGNLPAFNGFSVADWALDDILPFYDASALGNISGRADRLLALHRGHPGGRLTLTSGTPVTTSDVTAAGTIRYTPYLDDTMVLWDGTRWVLSTFAETSLALTATSGVNYDVFGYLSSGVLALETLAWTNDTTRATAVTYQDGRLCKSGDKTRLYLGTFRASAANVTEDSALKRFIWNMYNRVPRTLAVTDTTDSWTYTSATWRQARGSSANQVALVRGADEDAVEASVVHWAGNSGSVSLMGAGVGVDSSTVNSAQIFGGRNPVAAVSNLVVAFYRGAPGLGYHELRWLERSNVTTGTTTWFGDGGAAELQTGLVGSCLA